LVVEHHFRSSLILRYLAFVNQWEKGNRANHPPRGSAQQCQRLLIVLFAIMSNLLSARWRERRM